MAKRAGEELKNDGKKPRLGSPLLDEKSDEEKLDPNIELSQDEATVEIQIHPTFNTKLDVATLWGLFLTTDPETQLSFDLARFSITNGWKYHDTDGWGISRFAELAGFCGNRTIRGVALYAVLSACYRSTRLLYKSGKVGYKYGGPVPKTLNRIKINQLAQEIVHKAAPALHLLLNGEGLDILDSSLHGYEKQEILGKGGYGEVWKVHRKRHNDPCALKISLYALNEQQKIDARLEVDHMMTFDSKYVVKCFAHFEHDNKFYIAMELCDSDLEKYISEKANSGNYFDNNNLWEITIGCSVALFEVHSEGYLHRDVKPANYLLGPNMNLKISDMGLAKVVETSESTTANEGGGTIEYKSPQRLEGAGFSKRDDVWALGCTLFRAATFKYPFGARPNFSFARCIAGQFDKDLLQRHCDAKLFQYICSCLTLDSKQRPTIYELLLSISDRLDGFDSSILQKVARYNSNNNSRYNTNNTNDNHNNYTTTTSSITATTTQQQ